ncbi:MAG: GNAT family N-acetyltransferase [Clostridia bacterium]|nr:GNAT family N-acetyltransferase [Clostridia bacterium]
MFFRKATMLDISAVVAIYDGARRILRESGIPQWQEGVPGRESFITDVQDGVAYVLEDEGKVIATVQIIDSEPYYDKISDGVWTENSAMVAHRVAVSNECRKKGVGSAILSYAEELAKKNGKKALRLDTHELNYRMRGMLEKNGYIAVGTVHMPSGESRVAYEKVLK